MAYARPLTRSQEDKRPDKVGRRKCFIPLAIVSPPIILVGRIISSSKVGVPRYYEVNGTPGDAQRYP